MRACRRVMSNKGSAGIDGMTVKGLYNHLLKNERGVRGEFHFHELLFGVFFSFIALCKYNVSCFFSLYSLYLIKT
jgi:hypothetical protein